MRRREVIKRFGLGLSTGMLLPTWLGSCSEEGTPDPIFKYDGVVAIIGAGAAGLYAADILLSQGVDVVIYEASGRIGGRVHSLRSTDTPTDALIYIPDSLPNNSFPIELGPEFIFGSDSLWGEIVNKQKVPVVDIRSVMPDDGYILDQIFKASANVQDDADFIAAKNFIESLKTYSGANVSVQDAIQSAGINSRVHAILNSWIGNRMGTSNDRLSAFAVGEAFQSITHNDVLQMPTSNPMQNILLSRFNGVTSKVKLNAPIKSIDYSGETVTIVDKNDVTTTANKVIVTVPVSILKEGGIQFTPALPANKTTALSRIGMDASIHVALEFKKNIWNETSAFIFGGGTVPSYFSSSVGRSDANKFLNLSVNGPSAENLSSLGGDGIIDAILDEMDTALNGQASANISKDLSGNIISVIRDWTKEEYIKGGMSYNKPGGTNADRESLAESVSEKVFFAGEATDVTGDFGTITGALQSAERVATEVLESIKA